MCLPSRRQQASSMERDIVIRRSPSCSYSCHLDCCSSGQTTRMTTLSSAVQREAGGQQLKSCTPSWECTSTWAFVLCLDGTCTGVSSTSNHSSLLSSLVGASSSSSATSMSHHRHPLLLPLTRCPACVLSSSRCSTPSLTT